MVGMLEAEFAAKHGAEFRRCLLELDVDGLARLWNAVGPFDQRITRKEALYTLHLARTQAECVPMALRMYSDRWLRTRGIGSFLPERHQLHPNERR